MAQQVAAVTRILITGANRGIGLEFTSQFLKKGYTVVACCRTPDKADALKKMKAANDKLLTIEKLDVTSEPQIADLKKRLGDTPIDMLILNAGVITHTKFGKLVQKEMMDIYHINTVGAMLVTQALWDNVAASKRKQVVAISTGLASIADNKTGGYLPYRMSKAAMNMGFREVALEGAKRSIHTTILCPGWVKTDLGGADAFLTVDQSVDMMMKVVEHPENFKSGEFYLETGKQFEW